MHIEITLLNLIERNTNFIHSILHIKASDGENEKALINALKNMRDMREPQLRTTFVASVNSNPKLGDAQIDTLPGGSAIGE